MSLDHRDVDRRFRQWAARQAPEREHLRKLGTRIANEACRRQRMGTLAPRRPHSPPVVPRPVWLTAAALLLGAVLVWKQAPRPEPNEASGSADHAAWARISAAQADGDRRLFEEMERLFAGRFRWVAEWNGDINIGVAELPGGTDPATRPVAVRLVVVARDTGNDTWQPVWSSQVLLRADERIELSPPGAGQGTLAVWAHAVDAGAIAVESEVRLLEPVPVASATDTVLSDGVPIEIARVRRGGREYRVLQTARLL